MRQFDLGADRVWRSYFLCFTLTWSGPTASRDTDHRSIIPSHWGGNPAGRADSEPLCAAQRVTRGHHSPTAILLQQIFIICKQDKNGSEPHFTPRYLPPLCLNCVVSHYEGSFSFWFPPESRSSHTPPGKTARYSSSQRASDFSIANTFCF